MQLSFPLPLLILIYSMIGQLICEYESFCQDDIVESQVTVNAMGLLFQKRFLHVFQ